MKKKHPKQVIFFIWLCNLVAIGISIAYWLGDENKTAWFDTPGFLVWLILVCVARHGGLFRFVDSKISAGLGCIFEFAALIIVPFSQFVTIILISLVINITDRLIKKHPEPFLGPDFNASNVIIGGFLSSFAFQMIYSLDVNSDFYFTLALFCKAIIFGAVQVLLVNTLICLDEKINWKQGPAIKADTVIMEGILLITGSLLAVSYLYNPFLLIFFIFPALFLQKLLQSANKAQLIYIDEKINELFLSSKRAGKPLALIFGDMDYLRDVNNNYGHSAGDDAIVSIGKIFKECQKEQFVSARFGGEEFVMILPDITKFEASKHAETIRKKVEGLDLRSEKNEKIPLSISLGVASYPIDADDIQTLLQVADEALYDAKRNGRNQVKLYTRKNIIEEITLNQKGEGYGEKVY